ncbi:hypothetical protein BDZ89DRAFT_1051585 [Hymenopellis radicata]|nr:hypothetical protein BDZ89DRAFT_1051585 [Hymenopellis radicata]
MYSERRGDVMDMRAGRRRGRIQPKNGWASTVYVVHVATPAQLLGGSAAGTKTSSKPNPRRFWRVTRTRAAGPGAVSLNLVAAAAAHPPAVGASPVVQTPLVVVATSPTPASTVATPPVVTPAANPLPATNHGYPPYQVLPPGFPYQMPPVGSPGPYYAITRGRVVGVIAGWWVFSLLNANSLD